MQDLSTIRSPIRFGTFEVDHLTGELRKQGVRIKLQEQPFQALLLMLQSPGEVVTREEFQKRLWPENTFVDFDRGLNRAINKIRDALGDNADTPRFIETIPHRGYRFIAPVDMESPKPDEADRKPHPVAPVLKVPVVSRRGWQIFSVVCGSLLVLLVGLAVGRGHRPRSIPVRIESVAVLPLEDLSGESSREYFADGMTDGLITEIAKIRSLRVISRTSVMQYKVPRKPLPVIAQELGVDAVIEGTVTRVGDRVRITAQLVRASDDRHLWSAKYERDVSDIFKVQNEVAQAIADGIQISVSSDERSRFLEPPSSNPEAFEAYLTGRSLEMDSSPQQIVKTVEFYRKAVELDPKLAQGHAALAIAYCKLGIFGIRAPAEAYTNARQAAKRALELNPTLAEAHTALADVHKGFDWDWRAAEAEYRQALTLNPSYALGRQWYAEYLSKMGRHDEAIAEARRARELDPRSPGTGAVVAMLLYRARRYDEALVTAQKVLDQRPNHPTALWFLGLSYAQQGKFPEAIAALEKSISSSGGQPLYQALLSNVYGRAGNQARAMSLLNDLKSLSERQYVSPVDFAIIYTGLGNTDSAFRWLEKAYEERTMRIQELPDPLFDHLRSHSHFADLLKRIGLPL